MTTTAQPRTDTQPRRTDNQPPTGSPEPATGFCRITVAAPNSPTVDLAVPEDVAVAQLLPTIHALTAHQSHPPASPTSPAPLDLHLVRLDGRLLDPERTLAEQHVPDGEALLLRPLTRSLPGPVYDDLAEALAPPAAGIPTNALAPADPADPWRPWSPWSRQLLRPCALFATAALLTALAEVLRTAAPGRGSLDDPGVLAGVCAAVLLLAAATRARRRSDEPGALALGLPALALGAVAAARLPLPFTGGLPGTPGAPGAAPPADAPIALLHACLAVTVAGALLTALLPRAPFLAATVFGALSAGAVLAAILTGTATPAGAARPAAVTATLALAALPFLPALAVRLAHLPTGHAAPNDPAAPAPIDVAALAQQARRADRLLLGLLAGCSLAALAAVVVLTRAPGPWNDWLALALTLSLLLAARSGGRTPHLLCPLAAGLTALTALVLHGAPPEAGLPLPLLTAAVAVLGVILVTARTPAGTLSAAAPSAPVPPTPPTPPSPAAIRALELAETLARLPHVPLTLAVLGLL
jgi:type VII secretion integral membrane protein EccD